MKKSMLLLLVFCLFSGPAYGREYVLSMLPRYYSDKLTKMMSPLADYLSEQTGEKVRLELTKNFTDYENKLGDGTIDIGYENPFVFSNVVSSHEAIAMAVDKRDGEKFRGIVISRPDSGVKTLADLTGKTVMIVGETSAGGYLSQKLSLMETKIDTTGINYLTAAENRQENVIIPVSVGDVDAGFIRESAFSVADKYIIPGSVAKVVETAWLPNWAVSVNRGMEPEVKEKIVKALTSLKADSSVMQAIGMIGFKQATDDDYTVMQGLVE